jgi:hypothetical protein
MMRLLSRAHRPRNAVDDAFVFRGRDGGASDQGSLRRRVPSLLQSARD